MGNPRKDIHDKIWGVLGQQKPDIKPPAGKPVSLLRQHLWEIIEKDQGKLGYIVNLILLATILLSLIILPVEFVAGLSEYHDLALTVEIVTTIILTTEYFLRVYAAPNRLRYIFSAYGIIDLIAILPFYLSFLHAKILPFVRLLRLIRIIKIIHIRSLDENEEEVKTRSLLSHKVDLMTGENIEKIAMKHPIFFLIGLLLPLVLGSTAIFILLFWDFQIFAIAAAAALFLFMIVLVYNAWLDYFYDVIYITNYRLIFQNKHLFGYANNQVEYRSITNIRASHTSIWSTLLNFGKIIVETSSDQGFIEDYGVRRHEKVVSFIQQKCRDWTEVESRRGGFVASVTKN